eukprot:3392658-Pyramimonas_sp.AAC.1
MCQLACLDFSRLVAMGRAFVIWRCWNPGEHRSFGGQSCRLARHGSIVSHDGPVVGILPPSLAVTCLSAIKIINNCCPGHCPAVCTCMVRAWVPSVSEEPCGSPVNC